MKISKNNAKVVEASEKIGVQAAKNFMANKHHPDYKLVLPEGKGKGEFDLVYKNDKGGYIVIEAKGGQGVLGSKNVDGKRVEQGTKPYLESTASGDAKLTDAIDNGDVKYLLVEQPINSDNIIGTTKVSEFTIYE